MPIQVRKFNNVLIPINGDEQSEELTDIPDNSELIIEIKELSDKDKRNLGFHRKYFALLNYAFNHWDVKDHRNFDVFRGNIAILSGHYNQGYDFNGNVILTAKSISFKNMSEKTFTDLYTKSIDVIIAHVLQNYKKEDLRRCVDAIIGFS